MQQVYTIVTSFVKPSEIRRDAAMLGTEQQTTWKYNRGGGSLR